MPGVFGYFDPRRRLSDSILPRMAQVLRGSVDDQCAIERSNLGGFGIVNYAGRPLIEGEGNRRYVVFGHLDAFGVEESSGSHSEIAQRCLGTDHLDHIDQLRGSFVAISHNNIDHSMSLISDRFASQPLYIYPHEGILYFASQIKAILAVLPITVNVDGESVATMLSIGEVVGNRTLLVDVTTLPAATALTCSPAGERREKYWQYEYRQDFNSNWQETVHRAGSALKQAVQRSSRNARSVAVPLSGGLDSRFALDLACQADVTPDAYTWGIPECRDIRYAKEVAKRLNCRHEVFHFDGSYLASLAERGVWLTEGHTPATNFHVLPYVDELASRGHEVILDGFAGDVVLGGNFITDALLNSTDFYKSASALWLWRRTGFDDIWRHPTLDCLEQLGKDTFAKTYLKYPGQTPMDVAMAFLIDNRLRRTTTCGSEIFRSRMLVRQPFMEADFVDQTRTLPHCWRKRHKFYLAVLKQFAPISAVAKYQRTMLPATAPYWLNWASLAAQRGYSLLSSHTGLPDLLKGKSPSDFPSWFRGALKPYVQEVLLSERTLDRGVLPADAVRDALNQHIGRERDLSSLLGAMLSVELFCRLFLDDLSNSISRFSGVAESSDANLGR